ncbi:hypothetical protein SLEP1_g39281 [Rubroshorea leprosula]|uniref:Uncharacterized protein n=1 Tax=Rubroshorea leprosula TaxID=152421 RepID=A0AAV5L0V4_9ROSI|nr:hypothetical protein SLEP1_g39281 [Rubroshorea leprosula]
MSESNSPLAALGGTREGEPTDLDRDKFQEGCKVGQFASLVIME